jgi:hypothetical protein
MAGTFLFLPKASAFDPGPQLTLTKSVEVAAGIYERYLTGKTVDGLPLRASLLEVDLTQPLVEIRPALAANTVTGAATVAEIARSYGAVGAINGGFFGAMGAGTLPVGNLMIDGRLLAGNDMLRCSLGFTDEKDLLYGHFAPTLKLKSACYPEPVTVTGINRSYQKQGVTLYTPEWGTATGTPGGVPERILRQGENGEVVVGTGTGNSPIPPDGYVVAFGAALTELAAPLTPGTTIVIEKNFGPLWDGVMHLITAGPLLVENGQPVCQSVMEGFTGTILGRNPRSALGVTAARKLLLVVVDGRQPGYSVGVTLEEMGYLMAALGATTAVGLDGGGSSQLWAQGKIINQLISGERKINNALLVLSQIPVWLDGTRLFFDVPPALVHGRTMVPLRRIFEALGAQVHWDQDSGQVLAYSGTREVKLTLGQPQAMVNGEPQVLDQPALIIQGRTMVPLRFVGEALGAVVDWNPVRKEVNIKTGVNLAKNS